MMLPSTLCLVCLAYTKHWKSTIYDMQDYEVDKDLLTVPTSDRFKWVTVTDGKLPEDAVECGLDKDGTKLYVGRAYLLTELLPAKISCSPKKPDFYFAYVPSNGAEYKLVGDFEVLVSKNVAWISRQDGDIHEQAIEIAQTSTGEKLYYGRAFYKGTMTPGKVQPSRKCLYIPYSDKEISIKQYEVMILL